MKKFLSLALLIVLTLTLLITGCKGKKAVQNIELDGLKREYEIGEKIDYTGVTAKVVYNDGTSEPVDLKDLEIVEPDTSIPGPKDLVVTYKDFTAKFAITVKSASIDVGNREIQSIEYFNGLPANIYVGENINFNLINIIANYVNAKGEETEETISVGANTSIKHNGAEINTSVPGTYTLTITYMGKSVDVPVVIKALELVELQVVAGSVDTTIYENQDFDPTGIIVKAVYNSGAEYQIPVDQLTFTRNDNIITISYQGKSVNLTLSYDTPYVTGIAITTTGYEDKNNTVVYGDTLSTASVRVKATYSNNTTQMLTAGEFTVTHDIDQIGEGTLTVTYNADTTMTASVTFTVLGINKVVIDTSSVSTLVKVGDNFSTADLKVIITCSDGSRVQRTITDGVVVNATGVDTAKKDTYYITASYGGITSANLGIIVYEEINYIIAGIENPYSTSEFEANKEPFLNKSYSYVVGDDNPFIFRLKLTAWSENNELLQYSPSYTSYSEVYLNGALLSGDELAKYCVIDEVDNSFDFTEEAIGKTFTLKTRPRFGVDGRDDATKELTVTVVDGLNIYEAWELNYITNYNDSDAPGMENRTQYVDAFLNEKGATRPATLAGIVLHSDLIIKREDVPKEYFVDGNRNNDFYDYITIFAHATDSVNKTFTFHGNYYTIFSYELPNVCAKDIANQTDHVSSGQLFRFTCNQAIAGYNHTDYTTNIQNLYLKDDNPNKDNEATANRDMLGLIGMKVQWQVANLENVVIEAYYISFYVDCDDSTANVNECKFYNAYQNHIYAYNSNRIQGDNEAPHANYSPVTINITNSEITKCGGPVILTQCENPDYVRNSKSGPQVNIDTETEIWTWVTGQEAWFKANGATTIASQIQGLGLLLYQNNMPKTFVRPYGEDGIIAGENIFFMNMVMVNIVSGTNITDILGFTGDLDGTFTVGDTKYLDMTDTVALDGVHGYGSQTVATSWATQAFSGKKPIILNTHTDCAIVVDDGTVNGEQVAIPSATPAGNVAGIADGDYIALYYGCFGFVFGYAPFQ